MVLSNGAVGFIDPTNWMVVPNYPVTNDDGSVCQMLDLGTLTNLTTYGTNAALTGASEAFASAGLTPPFGLPDIHHTTFNALFTNNDNTTTLTIHKHLDTTVRYTFILPAGANAYPLIGPGAKAIVAYGPAATSPTCITPRGR